MAQTQPRIAILGGGPSGLLLARLLEMGGLTDYIVFERDTSAEPGPEQQGGTLDLHETSGQMGLKRAGLYEQFSNKLARWDASCIHILNPQGTTVIRQNSGSRPEIDRLQLRQLLLDSIPTQKIRWGHKVKFVEQGQSAPKSVTCAKDMVIHFADGSMATGFDLVVGADGSWSKVRTLITSTKPRYSGKMFIEGRISAENPSYSAAQDLAGPGNLMSLGHGKNLNVQQVADKTYRVYFGLNVPQDFYSRRSLESEGIEIPNSQQQYDESLRQNLLSRAGYGTWAEQLKHFIQYAEGPFRPWPLFRFDPEDVPWDRAASDIKGLTLVGDACHCSTPFAGEGVNVSMQDAVVLADALVRHCRMPDTKESNLEDAIEAALTLYESDMFARGQALIRKSTEIEEIVYGDNAAEELLKYFMTMGAAS